MEAFGYLAVLAIVAGFAWIKLRPHTGLGRQWYEDAGTPGSEGEC